MKKLTKFTMFLYAYFFICIIHSTYTFFIYSKNYFTGTKNEKSTILVDKKDSLVSVVDTSHTITTPIASRIPIGSFQYTFLKNSNVVPVNDELVLNDSEFTKYKKQYNYYLNKYFSPKQLKGVKEIVIADAELFDDGSVGITESINNNSYIIMASKANDSTVIIHEACHAFQAYYMDIFNTQYKSEWLKCKKYVSDYAKTNLYEDFAETGTAYLMGDTLKPNPKFKLFADFYKQTKKLK